MRKRNHALRSVAALFCFLIFWGDAQGQAIEIPPAGGGSLPSHALDEFSDEWRGRTLNDIQQNIARLTRDGRLPNMSSQAQSLGWPVAKAPGAPGFYVDVIAAFLDQDPSYPGSVLDYNCGVRTYDMVSGYNHRAVDIAIWPFAWYSMDNNYAHAVSAADGTIILKTDGYYDRSCSTNGDPANAVFVRHNDGSVAWYLHLKKDSLTTKNVGDTVAKGEFIGGVGSSGPSRGPHLHFELYDSENQLQDPFAGACNALNNFSWWTAQPTYTVSRIQRLMTHSAPPVFPACPEPEIPNEATTFPPGGTIYTAAYYRDQLIGQTTEFAVIRPDGSVYMTWDHNSPGTYTGSYWFWLWLIPQNIPTGQWKFRATFQGQTYETLFDIESRKRGGQTISID